MFLSKRYKAILEVKKQMLPSVHHQLVEKKITKIMKEISGKGKTIDDTIFFTFKGPCVPPGTRPPTEVCGSAKSIACFAAWGQPKSLFDKVHKAVGDVIRRHFQDTPNNVQEIMVNEVLGFCPDNCFDWIEPFQNIMLVWEQREHPNKYRVTPNCLPLGKGGI
ncbi:hypothetical protein BGZ73_006333 [Actinomortierella ambigua]|nr:hypothetical protein BGZ73_006333 [Actinomortierella ambigua]